MFKRLIRHNNIEAESHRHLIDGQVRLVAEQATTLCRLCLDFKIDMPEEVYKTWVRHAVFVLTNLESLDKDYCDEYRFRLDKAVLERQDEDSPSLRLLNAASALLDKQTTVL